jgi:hypothetical protein
MTPDWRFGLALVLVALSAAAFAARRRMLPRFGLGNLPQSFELDFDRCE